MSIMLFLNHDFVLTAYVQCVEFCASNANLPLAFYMHIIVYLLDTTLSNSPGQAMCKDPWTFLRSSSISTDFHPQIDKQ